MPVAGCLRPGVRECAWVVCVVLSCLVASARVAAAQPADGDRQCSESDESRAKELFKQAEQHRQLEEYLRAKTAYQSAYEVCPTKPFLLFNAAQMLVQANLKVQAVPLFEKYLQIDPDGRAADTVKSQILLIAEERFAAGDREQASGLFRRVLAIEPTGERAEIARARLNALAVASSVDTERAEPDTDKLAEPVEKKSLTEVSSTTDAAQEEPIGRGRSWVGWSILGVGLAAAGAGGVFHWQWSVNFADAESRLQEACRTGCSGVPADIEELASTAQLQSRLALAGYVVGGAALVTGAILLLRHRKRAKRRTEPAVGARADRPQLTLWPATGRTWIGGTVQLRF